MFKVDYETLNNDRYLDIQLKTASNRKLRRFLIVCRLKKIEVPCFGQKEKRFGHFSAIYLNYNSYCRLVIYQESKIIGGKSI
jgi:hypothetical protein